jgi:hypothetical protein
LDEVRIVVKEGLTFGVVAVDPVTLAIEFPSAKGATTGATEFTVPDNRLTGAVTVFTTGNDDRVVVSEPTVAGMELTVEVTEVRTGDVTPLVTESKVDGSVATAPVIELMIGSDVTVVVSVLSVVGRLAAMIELTTGRVLTVFVKLSSGAGTVPTTLFAVELTTDVGLVRRVPTTGVDAVAVATAGVADAGSTIAEAGAVGESETTFIGDVAELAADVVGAAAAGEVFACTAFGVSAVIRAN